MKRRFIYNKDNSHKFWEIELNGNSYTTYYGKIGSNPRSDTNSFADAEKAQLEYEKIIKEKVKKGYTENLSDQPNIETSVDQTIDIAPTQTNNAMTANEKTWLDLFDALLMELYSKYECGEVSEKIGLIYMEYTYDYAINFFVFSGSDDVKVLLEQGKPAYFEGTSILENWNKLPLFKKCTKISTNEEFVNVINHVQQLESFKQLSWQDNVYFAQYQSSEDISLTFFEKVKPEHTASIKSKETTPDQQQRYQAIIASKLHERMGDLWKKIATAYGDKIDLEKGADYKKICSVEAKLKIQLPDELISCLLWHNGAEGIDDTFINDQFDFLGIEAISSEWQTWNDLYEDGTFEGTDVECDKEIQAVWYQPKWIPITSDGAGNNYCLDLDPTQKGTSGQIITLWHESNERKVIAPSLEQLLIDSIDPRNNT